ncbi:MAG: dUTP diphosphatase [Proteobacteria bacterium]|nr:dUTP diphosphatase [Pseudomonadota bacterium]
MTQRITVKIMQLHEHAVRPKYQTPGSAGVDLHACEECEVWTGSEAIVSTGIAMEIPQGYEGQIRPRSGLAAKNMITVLNSPGTIDSDYRGEIKVILVNHGDGIFKIRRGDRIAQMVFTPIVRAEFEDVSSLDETSRGSKGFGSTGV